MNLHILKSKIHRARLTQCDLEYEGSLGIDTRLMQAAGILPYERILVVNATNGERLETYAIPEAEGSRTFCLNGAAARRGEPGDMVTIMSFAVVEQSEAAHFAPKMITLDRQNEIVKQQGG